MQRPRSVQHPAQFLRELYSGPRGVQKRGLRLDWRAGSPQTDFEQNFRTKTPAHRRRARTCDIQPARPVDAETSGIVHDGRPETAERSLGESDWSWSVQDRPVDERLPRTQNVASIDLPWPKKLGRQQNTISVRLLPRTRRFGPPGPRLLLRTALKQQGPVHSPGLHEDADGDTRLRPQQPTPELRNPRINVPQGEDAAEGCRPEPWTWGLQHRHQSYRARRPRWQHVLAEGARIHPMIVEWKRGAAEFVNFRVFDPHHSNEPAFPAYRQGVLLSREN